MMFLFRPLRLVRAAVLLVLAFGAGMFYAEITARADCREIGGDWAEGICREAAR